MPRTLVLGCASLVLSWAAAPLAAQDMTLPPAPPAAADQLPPPPPFPPMPSSRPSHRVVSIGGHHSSRSDARKSSVHKARSAKHHAAKHGGRAHSSKGSVRRSAHRAKPLHFSKKTVRQCHGMTYRQIMRHSSCRALIKQELAAPTQKQRTSHRISHGASSRHRSKHHSTKRRRR